jgi:hypothetical protein
MPPTVITQLQQRLQARYTIAKYVSANDRLHLEAMGAQELSHIAYIKYAFGNTTFVSNGQTYTVSQLCDALVASPPTPSVLSQDQYATYLADALIVPLPTTDFGTAFSTLSNNIIARYMLQSYGKPVPPANPSAQLSAIVSANAIGSSLGLFALYAQFAPPNTFTPSSYAQLMPYLQ